MTLHTECCACEESNEHTTQQTQFVAPLLMFGSIILLLLLLAIWETDTNSPFDSAFNDHLDANDCCELCVGLHLLALFYLMVRRVILVEISVVICDALRAGVRLDVSQSVIRILLFPSNLIYNLRSI